MSETDVTNQDGDVTTLFGIEHNEVRDRMAGYLMDRVLDEIKAMPDTWLVLNAEGQGMVLERLRNAVFSATTKAVREILLREFPTWNGKVEQVTLKGGQAKVVVAGYASEKVLSIADSVDDSAFVVIASAEAFMAGLHDEQPTPDQSEMLGDAETES